MRYCLVGILCLGATPAFGSLVFNPTFTPAFNTNFGVNAAAAQGAWNAAAAIFSNAFNNNITLNITVDAVPGTSTLGMSSQNIFSISYPTLYNDVLALAMSADDLTATGFGGSLGGNATPGSAADPIGGSHNWWINTSQEKLFGILAGNNAASSGTTTFGAGFNYSYNGTASGTQVDFQGVAAHEISEIMGRIGICGNGVGGSPGYTLLDAYSFSGAGTRNTGNGANANFSVNNGATLIKAFNNQASFGGDCRDWAIGTNDAFNASTGAGVANPVSATDIRLLDVLGYTLTPSPVPEPATAVLIGGGLLAVGLVRRRQTQKL